VNQARLFDVAPAAPDLAAYDLVLVNASAGKDSQAALDVTVAEADRPVLWFLLSGVSGLQGLTYVLRELREVAHDVRAPFGLRRY
jgi:hypothetical protein